MDAERFGRVKWRDAAEHELSEVVQELLCELSWNRARL